jgi:hypothetical protein
MVQYNLKNPTVVPVPNPIDLDLGIADLQNRLSAITWLTKIFGRAREITRKSEDGKTVQRIPMVYQSDGEYYPALPNDALSAYSFFVAGQPRSFVDAKPNDSVVFMQSPVALIVWGNLKTVETGLDYIYTENLINQVVTVLKTKGQVELVRVFDETARDIFRGYTLNETQQGLLMHPYFAFRIEFMLSYRIKCTPASSPFPPFIIPSANQYLRVGTDTDGLGDDLKTVYDNGGKTSPLQLSKTKIGIGGGIDDLLAFLQNLTASDTTLSNAIASLSNSITTLNNLLTIEQLDTVTFLTSGTFVWDFANKKQRQFIGDLAFTGAKTVALDNTTNAKVFDSHIQITTSATLTLPSNFEFDNTETRWDSSTKVLTLTGTGRYEITGTYGPVTGKWKVKATPNGGTV